MGEIWRLDTSAGVWAVKWQYPWVPTEARPSDLHIQRTAAAAGIPLPLPVTAPDGAAVVEIRGRHARVYHWVDLGAPVAPPAPAATAAEAGRLLGLLHGLAIRADEPVDPWYTEVPTADYWTDLTDRATRAGAAWAASLTSALGLIADLSELAVPLAGRPHIICHRDFNPDNVLPAASDGRLVVLDWENAGPLDAVRELGYALFTWCSGGGRFDKAAAAALLAEYATAAGAEPELGCDLFATAVAAHVNVVGVMAEQSLREPEHRDFAETLMASILDHDLDDLRRITKLRPDALRHW
jgi:Ser/Thr protein kinase RdoA (MazF antagonist)